VLLYTKYLDVMNMVKVVRVGDEVDYQYNDLEEKIIDILDELYSVRNYYINPSHLMNFDYDPHRGQLKMNIEVYDKKFILSSLITGVNNYIILNKVLPIVINSYLLFIRNFDPVFRVKLGLSKHLSEEEVESISNSNLKSMTHYFVNKTNKTGTLLFSLNDKQVCSASVDKSTVNIVFLPDTLRYYTKPRRLTFFWMFIMPGLLPVLKVLGYDKSIINDVYDAYYRRFYLGDDDGSSGRCVFEKRDDGSSVIECINY